MQLETPVAFFVFNRPELARTVFDEIRRARPRKLFVVADGPRPDRPGEADACAAARRVATEVDWKCDVVYNYSDKNLGCRKRVASGLDWVFGQCDSAIVLEDDCLPDQCFFPFCSELLDRFREDERVMLISGNNFDNAISKGPYSYYFTRRAHTWGWAAWSRTWKHYDVNLSQRRFLFTRDWLIDVLGDEVEAREFEEILDALESGLIDTWDYQLAFACWIQHGLTVIPSRNLVRNIGFGPGATHTVNLTDPRANIGSGSIEFPLRHPPVVIRNLVSDWRSHYRFVSTAALVRELARRVLRPAFPPAYTLRTYLRQWSKRRR